MAQAAGIMKNELNISQIQAFNAQQSLDHKTRSF